MANILYQVTTYTATDSWTDITPTALYIPKLPYGLAVDTVSSANVETFANDDITFNWYTSTDTTGSWVDNGASNYRTGVKAGDILFLGGLGIFDISDDNGTTLIDKLGNLGVVWGSVGTIKQIQVLIE